MKTSITLMSVASLLIGSMALAKTTVTGDEALALYNSMQNYTTETIRSVKGMQLTIRENDKMQCRELIMAQLPGDEDLDIRYECTIN